MTDDRIHTRVDGAARTVGVIGWPVAHSLSPLIHNTAFIALDLDWVYLPLPVRPGELAPGPAWACFPGFAGANVTMPHKSEAAQLCDDALGGCAASAGDEHDRRRAGPARRAQHGHAGIRSLPAPRRRVRSAGAEALVFGAGGAGRSCALALARAGLRRLHVAVRIPSGAEGLVRALEGIPTQISVIPFGEAGQLDVPLVINATPLGANGEELVLPAMHPDVLAVDLLYRPSVTPFQLAAREAGAASFGGLGLLLHQAALSFELWTGQVRRWS